MEAPIPLAAFLREAIRERGPMRFDAWMRWCLYGRPDSYYQRPGRKTGAARDADFATSPTLHPFLAQAVAREAAEAWQEAGRPPSFAVVELGGGEGDLARDALAWLDAHVPALARVVQWRHIDLSAPHRDAQRAGTDARITAAAEPGEQEPFGLVVGNEFLDAVPFRWLERTRDGWLEVAVGLDGEAFATSLQPCGPMAMEEALPIVAPGQRVAFMEDALLWHVAQLDLRVAKGRALFIDYGDEARRLWTPDRPDGTVRAFRRHQPADPLQDPGEADITASVDFTATCIAAESSGTWRQLSLETQEAFLLRHGILEALNATDRTTAEGASRYLRLRQLVLPTGLGTSFKVQRFERV